MTSNAFRRSALLIVAMLMAAFNANAALQGSGTTTVISLRVEGSYGFIGFYQPMPICGDQGAPVKRGVST